MTMPDPHSLEAVILCGGRGSRLKPLTDTIPKAMVPFHGRPMIDHIINFLGSKGISDFTICIGYLGDKIKQHFSGDNGGKDIVFSDAGEEAGMLKRIWLASKNVGKRFVVAYGDTFLDINLQKLESFHIERGAAITIVVAKIQNPFGVVECDDDGWATSFTEKPTYNYYLASFIAEKSAFKNCGDDLLDLPDGEGLIGFFNKLIEQKKLAAFVHEGLELTFNTETEKQHVELELGKFFTQAEST